MKTLDPLDLSGIAERECWMSRQSSRLVRKLIATAFGLAFIGFVFWKGDEIGMVFFSGGFKLIAAAIVLLLIFDMWRTEL